MWLVIVETQPLTSKKISHKKNINLKLIKKDNTNTILKTRYIDHLDNRKFMGIYDINDSLLKPHEEEKLLGKLKEIKKYDIVIVADYGHGLITKKFQNLLQKIQNFYV